MIIFLPGLSALSNNWSTDFLTALFSGTSRAGSFPVLADMNG